MQYLFIALFLLCPFASQAAITISEVAWMGSAVSANDEWIELYNDGVSQSVDGWVLSDGMNLSIPLTGTIPESSFAVLERTDDASVAGTAFLVYAGALTNSGATLTLRDASGVLVDQVAGGDVWEYIGGDNTTKETAQYTQDGWVTAQATPGRALLAHEVPEEVDEEEEQTYTETSDVTMLHHQPRTLQVTPLGSDSMYVNQEVDFTVETSGLADGILNSLTHSWNFGDTYTGAGSEVSHRFAYPGEYVVTVHSAYGQYEAVSRKRVVVLPVIFSLALNQNGEVQLHNNARYEIDVSGYRLAGVGEFVFPEHSVLLAGATVTIPRERVARLYGTPVILFDTVGEEVARYDLVSKVAALVASEPVTPAVVSGVSTQPLEMPQVDIQDVASSTQQQASVIAAPAASVVPVRWPYLGLVALIGLGLLVIFAGRVDDETSPIK